jgi:hypothetical protein
MMEVCANKSAATQPALTELAFGRGGMVSGLQMVRQVFGLFQTCSSST